MSQAKTVQAVMLASTTTCILYHTDVSKRQAGFTGKAEAQPQHLSRDYYNVHFNSRQNECWHHYQIIIYWYNPSLNVIMGKGQYIFFSSLLRYFLIFCIHTVWVILTILLIRSLWWWWINYFIISSFSLSSYFYCTKVYNITLGLSIHWNGPHNLCDSVLGRLAVHSFKLYLILMPCKTNSNIWNNASHACLMPIVHVLSLFLFVQ